MVLLRTCSCCLVLLDLVILALPEAVLLQFVAARPRVSNPNDVIFGQGVGQISSLLLLVNMVGLQGLPVALGDYVLPEGEGL